MNKDARLLEEAYNSVIAFQPVKRALQPLFNKLVSKIKEKSPETFERLRQANTSEELYKMIVQHNDTHGTIQNEGFQDTVFKIKEKVSEIIENLDQHSVGLYGSSLITILGGLITAAGDKGGMGMIISGMLFAAITLFDKYNDL